ncbi:L,D-transpeptidase family protein [Leptospira ilyithenensis]|uniref:L,D-transpeptidase family protein n=1 Tax=Leptospira ilyithenensis TaxID=2484901 RepID=UPI0014383E5D|nr:L,D-transpeptidase family protein [Leptospira ilyithenensis]
MNFSRIHLSKISSVFVLSLLNLFLFSQSLLGQEAGIISDSDPKQLIFVIQEPNQTTARIHFYELSDGDWVENLSSFLVSVGQTGMISSSLKREGDGKTPTGDYPVLRVFGYDENLISGFSYHRITKDDYWVDDVESKYYNLHIKKKPKTKQVHPLLRGDGFYRLMVVIEHNTASPEKGRGSMIFIHPWEELTKSTFGCIGMPYEKLKEMVLWLRYEKNPRIFISEGISEKSISP